MTVSRAIFCSFLREVPFSLEFKLWNLCDHLLFEASCAYHFKQHNPELKYLRMRQSVPCCRSFLTCSTVFQSNMNVNQMLQLSNHTLMFYMVPSDHFLSTRAASVLCSAGVQSVLLLREKHRQQDAADHEARDPNQQDRHRPQKKFHWTLKRTSS